MPRKRGGEKYKQRKKDIAHGEGDLATDRGARLCYSRAESESLMDFGWEKWLRTWRTKMGRNRSGRLKWTKKGTLRGVCTRTAPGVCERERDSELTDEYYSGELTIQSDLISCSPVRFSTLLTHPRARRQHFSRRRANTSHTHPSLQCPSPKHHSPDSFGLV